MNNDSSIFKTLKNWPKLSLGLGALSLIVVLAYVALDDLLLAAARDPNAVVLRMPFFRKSPAFWLISEVDLICGLNDAIKFKNIELADALIDSNVPLNSNAYFKQPLVQAAESGDFEMAERLLARGAPLNPDPDLYLFTPIMGAVIGNKPEMIKYLAKRGADIDLRRSTGRSPLAMAMKPGREEARVALSELGARELYFRSPASKTER